MTLKPIELVRDYHERTKHKLDGYARGPEFLDWDQQPDPFRRFAGAGVTDLPLLSSDAKTEVISPMLQLSAATSPAEPSSACRLSVSAEPYSTDHSAG